MVHRKRGINKRDLELIRWLCSPDKVICQAFGITETALQSRVHRLMERLEVGNRTSLVIEAMRRDLVTLDEFMVRKYEQEKERDRDGDYT